MLYVDEKLFLAFKAINALEKTDYQRLRDWVGTFDREEIRKIQVSCDDELTKLKVLIYSRKEHTAVYDKIQALFLNKADIMNFGEGRTFEKDFMEKEKFFTCKSSIKILDAFMESNPSFMKLKKWADLQVNCEVVSVHFSDVADPQFLNAQIELPNRSPREQIEAIEQLYKMLGIKGLGSSLAKVVDKFNVENIGLEIEINSEGIYKLGVSIYNPKRNLVLFFSGLAANSSDEKLAVFESIIDVDTPEYLTYCLYPDRWRTELFYSFDSK